MHAASMSLRPSPAISRTRVTSQSPRPGEARRRMAADAVEEPLSAAPAPHPWAGVAPWTDVGALTSAVSRGDTAAFGVLYEAWYERVYGLARALTRRDESFCLDVVQEVMLRAARSLKPAGTEAQLGGWFAKVTASVCVDAVRRETR